MLDLNFVSVEESRRVSLLLKRRRADLVKLMQEWEEAVEAIECST
jgi:hypothetical protein